MKSTLKTLKLLADPTRLRIINVLNEESLSVAELQEILGMGQSRISTQLAHLMKRLLDSGLDATILCTGGDTLLALMRTVGVAELTPVRELATGAVLTNFVYQGKTYHIISKSGGFGEPALFCGLAALVGAGNQRRIYYADQIQFENAPRCFQR